MRLLDRYLFRELLTPLAFCLGGFLIFWISFDLFNELNAMQDAKLHLLDVFEYALAMTPEFFVTILPVILLLALLYALTNHARHNEITAMRAAGISLWRICLPYFIIGTLAGAVLFCVNEFLVPRSADWADRIMSRHVQKTGAAIKNVFPDFTFKNPHANRFWIGEYHLDTREMIRPQVDWSLPDGSSRHLDAARAVFTNGVWTFFQAVEKTQAGSNAPMTPFLRTNILTIADFDERPKQFQSEIKINNYQTLSMRSADIPLTDIVNYLRIHPHLSRKQAGWLLTNLHGQLAAPFTCLVVVLIAIPFGAMSGRRNLFFGVAGSIFICFGFFVIQKIGLAFGSGGSVPAWLGAWLPNLIFAATGLTLTARAR